MKFLNFLFNAKSERSYVPFLRSTPSLGSGWPDGLWTEEESRERALLLAQRLREKYGIVRPGR